MRGRSVDVVILFEGAARELDVACAIKHILDRRHGLVAEIYQQNFPGGALLRDVQPAVVALPFCYQERDNNAYLVRWRRATFFNLTWEQLFYPGNATAKTPRGTFALQHVIHNAWGQAYAAFLRAQGVPEAHIFVSGSPALALYDEPYRHYFKTRSDLAVAHGLDATRSWVLFPENYNWAFYPAAMLDQMVRDGQPRSQVAAMRDVVSRSFEAAIRWAAGLVGRSDVELIVRPRPGTTVEAFRQRVVEVLGAVPERMSILKDELVRDWILASDVVVSSSSTSLIEASVAAKPAYILEPIPWPELLRQAWHDLVPHLTSEDELIAAVANPQPAASAALASWARAALVPYGDPILRLADELAGIRRREVAVPPPAPWTSVTLPGRLPRRLAFEFRRHVRPWLASRRPADTAFKRLSATAMGEIPDRVARWQPILDPYLESVARQSSGLGSPHGHTHER